jgi:HEAT repeat protein
MTGRPVRPRYEVVGDWAVPAVDVGRLRLRGDFVELCRVVRTSDVLSAAWALQAIGDIGIDALDDAERSAVLGTLLWCLEDLENEVGVYAEAARALGAFGERRSLPYLVRLLAYEYSNISDHQKAAAWALGELRDPLAIPALIETVSRPSLAETALAALSRIGSVEAVEPLVAEVGRIWWYPGMAAAARTLGELGDQRACPALLDLMAVDRADVRRAAATAIGQIGGPAAVLPLIRALGDADEVVAAEARDALSRMPEAGQEVRQACTSVNPVVRAAACTVLGHQRSPDATEVLAGTLRADPSSLTRAAAAVAMGMIGGARAQSVLAESLSDTAVCEIAGAALSTFPGPPDEAVVALLTHGTEAERRGALSALSIEGARSSIDQLIDAVNEGPLAVSRLAVEKLGALDDDRAVRKLLEVVGDDEQPGTLRASAAAALGSTDDPRVGDVLRTALAEGGPMLRLRAAESLGRRRDERAISELLEAARSDHSADVRSAAVAALAAIGPDAEAAFSTLLDASDTRQRTAAYELIGPGIGDRLVARVGMSLSSSDGAERLAATKALVRSRHPLSVDLLRLALDMARRNQLSAANWELARHALDGLLRFDDESAVETVLHCCRYGPRSDHARRALNVIVRRRLTS